MQFECSCEAVGENDLVAVKISVAIYMIIYIVGIYVVVNINGINIVAVWEAFSPALGSRGVGLHFLDKMPISSPAPIGMSRKMIFLGNSSKRGSSLSPCSNVCEK